MKETEKLELKQLTSYLPNGLWWYDPETETQWSTMSISSTGSIVIQRCDEITTPETPVRKCIFVNATFGFKLILRSLSDLTKEIEVDGEKFNPRSELWQLLGGGYSSIEAFENDSFVFTMSISRDDEIINSVSKAPYEVIEKLFEWHFDVYGLIPKGLAYDFSKLSSNKQTSMNSEN